MSALSEAFTNAFGQPDPPTPDGLRFARPGRQAMWESIHKEIGSGWFKDGFLYLFGEGLETLQPCLDAWSFLIPHSEDRMIIGRNAYGAIIVLDNSHTDNERVSILDPFTVTFASDRNVVFINLLGRWLPRELPGFIDDSAYKDWIEENHAGRLDLDDVLGIKVPKGLGGELVSSNLQIDGIVDYYQTTAPIYAKAFAALKTQGK